MFSIAASSRARDLAVRGFESAHLGELRVEVGGELGAVGVERVNLLGRGSARLRSISMLRSTAASSISSACVKRRVTDSIAV